MVKRIRVCEHFKLEDTDETNGIQHYKIVCAKGHTNEDHDGNTPCPPYPCSDYEPKKLKK